MSQGTNSQKYPSIVTVCSKYTRALTCIFYVVNILNLNPNYVPRHQFSKVPHRIVTVCSKYTRALTCIFCVVNILGH
jgi:hypothetical protein